MPMNWNEIRKVYPACKENLYFQSAAMSPLPLPTFEAIQKEYELVLKAGGSGFFQDLEGIEKLKSKIAKWLHTSSENLTFVPNTSTAFSLIGLSLDPKIHRLLSFKEEFPSSVIPFQSLGFKMKILESQNYSYPISFILKNLESVEAVVSSHVQYCTGFKQDIFSLGKELKSRNIHFIVNGTQSFPFFEIDVEKMNIDVLSVSLHKWSAIGHAGALLYTSPSWRKKFPVPVAGWTSVKPMEGDICYPLNDGKFLREESGRAYTLGTYNLQITKALNATYDLYESIGLKKISERVLFLRNYFLKCVDSLPLKVISPNEESAQSAIVALEVDDTKKLFENLSSQKILLSFRNGFVRVDFNIFNNEEDCEKLAEKIKNFIEK